jgi:hypothetical protein
VNFLLTLRLNASSFYDELNQQETPELKQQREKIQKLAGQVGTLFSILNRAALLTRLGVWVYGSAPFLSIGSSLLSILFLDISNTAQKVSLQAMSSCAFWSVARKCHELDLPNTFDDVLGPLIQKTYLLKPICYAFAGLGQRFFYLNRPAENQWL